MEQTAQVRLGIQESGGATTGHIFWEVEGEKGWLSFVRTIRRWQSPLPKDAGNCKQLAYISVPLMTTVSHVLSLFPVRLRKFIGEVWSV